MSRSPRTGGLATRAVHAGQVPDPTTGAVVPPIYQTSTYAQPRLGEHQGYQYARGANPTRTSLEEALAALEGASGALAFASGMAAVDATVAPLSAGAHLVASADMYGGTYRLFESLLGQRGVAVTYADTTEVAAVEAALRPETELLFVETPSNPLMRVSDLAALASLAKARRLRTVCDNTFLTPYLQNPLALGFDAVVHSTTKYLNGHSDAVGGAVVSSDEAWLGVLAAYRNTAGAVPGPFDCWLVARGIKTLPVRMERHTENASHLARVLEDDSRVAQVYYPGLPAHPHHARSARQARGAGGMLAVELGSEASAKRFMEAARVLTLAESLGGVESLMCYPRSMTHGFLTESRRLELGITPGLVRLSVGIEDAEDLVLDVKEALAEAFA